ncbi:MULTISPECIES: malto-oligosyltrehalose trehalohydrolase [Sorangium]|uniref:Malto-oligosyltrehalose trehalohydrolase n=1 Tax=Sorangium cellulosum (strain So ce56) TaxID=448385 RepID=A9ERZ2_SORC5|nr:malto-oligosyltrehalose trehalohydrolase [Sorangium cellulosum]CAN97339.1 Alpha-amylase-family protein [Sorangium cellulosum So ce56]
MLEFKTERRLPIGAEVLVGKGVHFRVWAPARRKVEVVLEAGPGSGGAAPLRPEEGGYFAGLVASAASGTRYRFRLDDGEALTPDPASRSQPEGPHGPSEVIDPGAFSWSDAAFRGAPLKGQVIYEMHIGTFTREGTWESAARELPELARIGVSLIELLPIAEVPGRFNWGYDGVNLFAPTRLYGSPDDLRRFVDAAHRAGIAVILDVVYNHLGPDGNYLGQFSGDYFTDRHKTDWGAAINFDGPRSEAVREYFIANAGYWIDEFHLDGLRLDATQNIYDGSKDHILAAIARRVREAAKGKETFLVAENESQEEWLIRAAERGGYGLDAIWNDDFHHSAKVALTGRSEAYYSDHEGSPQELLSALKHGFLFQGQRYQWQKQRRGTPALGVDPARFVLFLENHDQVANTARGERLCHIVSPGRLRAMSAALLLAPGTPMLFQGQEFGSSAPFLFFADHNPELAPLVRKGRAEFLEQFPSCSAPEVRAQLDDPSDPRTFERCKLDFSERERNAALYALHEDLIALRRRDPVIRAQRPRGVDGAVLSAHAFLLRYFGDDGDDRLLLVNLGRDIHRGSLPEPLFAPPPGRRWETSWSSESPRYGGQGSPPVITEEGVHIPGEAAILLHPVVGTPVPEKTSANPRPEEPKKHVR